MTNHLNNGTVNYTYDALNRLQTATGGAFSLGFVYDGFGNRTDQNLTAGTAPQMHLSIDPNTNRINSGGYYYDNNGNLTQVPGFAGTYTYDVENRIVSAATGSNGTDTYAYGPDSKRVYKMHPNGIEEYYFWVGSKKLGTYQLGANGSGNLAVMGGAAILCSGIESCKRKTESGRRPTPIIPMGRTNERSGERRG